MLSDEDKERLAKEAIAEMLNNPQAAQTLALYCHGFSFTDDGEPEPSYGATSTDGYGSYLCDYWPMAAVVKLVGECERMYDECLLSRKADSRSGVVETLRLKDAPQSFHDKNRAWIISRMLEISVHNLFTNMRHKLNAALWLNFEESKIAAEGTLGTLASLALARTHKTNVDARARIARLSNDLAKEERRHLKAMLSGLPRVLTEDRRGPKPRVTTERVRELLAEHGKVSKDKAAELLDCAPRTITDWATSTEWKTWTAARAALLGELKTGRI
jgi:hypothetical protein